MTMAKTSSSRLGARYVFYIVPVPAARPRVTKWGTYYPKKYAEFRKEFARLLVRTGLPRAVLSPLEVNLEFVCRRPKNPTNSYPMGDLDNYVKAVLDSIQSKAWFKDDKQIQAIGAYKRYTRDDEVPHIVMLCGDYTESEDVLDRHDTISIEEI